jgi:L,D-peptidoglycan transpeptidase YkuD (ErfK/YbiS/YcfS/YnhG family)
MIKTFLILISIQTFLFASQQIILVVSEDFNTSSASMECYEDGEKVFRTLHVNIGKNGLGWGFGEVNLTKKSGEPLKKEGDKKAPAGVFKLTNIFGYEEKRNLHMPYLFASKNLICVDDAESGNYNQIIHMTENKPKSFEYMKRDDGQYELGIVVAHNKSGVKQGGSCIFIHVEKFKNAPTVGCTSMTLEELKKITSWLDETKNPILIQIPKSSSKEILTLFPQLRASKLLNQE